MSFAVLYSFAHFCVFSKAFLNASDFSPNTFVLVSTFAFSYVFSSVFFLFFDYANPVFFFGLFCV